MPKRTSSINDEQNKERKQKKQKTEEESMSTKDKQEQNQKVTQGTTNAIQNSSQTTTVANVNDDYKKKPLLEWDEKDVQDFLNEWIEKRVKVKKEGEEELKRVLNKRRDFLSKFELIGSDLAKMTKEDLIAIAKDDALGRALFNDIQDILKKDQEKANPNKSIQGSSTTISASNNNNNSVQVNWQGVPIESGSILETKALDEVGTVQSVQLLRSGLADKSQKQQRMLYIRQECVNLWKKLNSGNLLIVGPPGTGKSSVTWAWCLWYCSQPENKEKKLRWIHLDGEKAHFIDLQDRKYSVPFAPINLVKIDSHLSSQEKFDIVVLDGISYPYRDQVFLPVSNWFTDMVLPSKRFIMVTSLQFKVSDEQYRKKEYKRIAVSGWTLQEYKSACTIPAFFSTVSNFLEIDSTQPIDDAEKEKKLNEKYYYAGASARWMFSSKMLDVQLAIARYVDEHPNVADLMNGIQGSSSLLAVNHLVTKIDGVGSVVSRYALKLLVAMVGVSFIIAATAHCEHFGGAFSGWLFQEDFLFHLQRAPQSTSKKITLNDKNTGAFDWPVAKCLNFRNLEEIFNFNLTDNCWLIPTKINQGCYDVLHLSGTTLRVVQLTVSDKHDFKLQYVVHLLETLQSKLKLNAQFHALTDVNQLKKNVELKSLPYFNQATTDLELKNIQQQQKRQGELTNQITKLELFVVVPFEKSPAFKPGPFFGHKHGTTKSKRAKKLEKMRWNEIEDKDPGKKPIVDLNWKPSDLIVTEFKRAQPIQS